MGCAPSKQEERAGGAQAQGGMPAAPNHLKLNQQLNERARHPSAIPGSFFERECNFRQEQRPKKAVPERHQGPCRVREGSWGSWAGFRVGWLVLSGHKLLFYAASGGTSEAAEPPSPSVKPECSWELVGAHLKMERKQELVLTPPDGGAAVTLAMPDEQQAQEWMVGLSAVPGLFRRVTDYYELGAAWGHGATCMVQECVSRYSGQRYALKSRLHNSRNSTEAMHNELRILQICAKKPHPAIPHLYDYFFDEDGSIELVIDLMEGGELFDHIAAVQQLREHDARAIFKQVAEGVAHLHSLGIAHRDLKPQNLMYVSADEGSQVKIMDYDLSKVNYAPDWEGYTPCGTIHYMAPEVVQHQRYSLAIDMWSLGVILYILFTGHMPFDGKTRGAIAQAIEAGQYRMDPKLWGDVSEQAKDLVRGLLQKDPHQRLTAMQVLQHPWLTTDLDPACSAELASPVQLRKTLSKTERGRKLLAIAALAYSEGDVQQPSTAINNSAGATSVGLPRLGRLSQNRQRLSAALEALDFDMQAVRDQAGPGISRETSRGRGQAARPLFSLGTTAEEAGEEEAVDRLRSQLETIGTAAGLQDRGYLQSQGVPLLPTSPRVTGHATADKRLAGMQRQQSSAFQKGFVFAELGVQEVEEHDLSDSDSVVGRKNEAVASWLPPDSQLPTDQQLLQTLGNQQPWQPAPPSAPGGVGSRRGLRRGQSAYQAGESNPFKALPRSISTSRLDRKDARIPPAHREPVDQAMQQKQQRLDHMRSATPTAQEWQQMALELPP